MVVSSPRSPQLSIADEAGSTEPQTFEWEQTSYTKIPRGWSRFRRETATFLRFIGLGLVVATIQGTFRKDFLEPKKVTVSHRRVASLLKALIHIPPLTFALFEIITNLRGHYLGASFEKQSSYQLAAKAHELAIYASLTAIVTSYIRYELLFGDGLPFGAFLGVVQLLSVSYLWSRELWSSVFATAHKLRKRIAFFTLILICGVIAATAGPSSATLLIPRQLIWLIQDSHILINGTFQDIWPDYMDPLQVPAECTRVAANPAEGNVLCPGSDWRDLLITLDLTDAALAPGGYTVLYAWGTLGANGETYYGTSGACASNMSSLQVCGVVESVAVADAAFNDSYIWDVPKDSHTSFLDSYHSITKNLYEAYVAVQCLQDTIENSEDESVVEFPILATTIEQYSHREKVSSTVFTKPELYAYPGNVSEFRLIFTKSPAESLGRNASGAILLNPRSTVAGSPQNITTCTLGAGWGSSTMLKDNALGITYVWPTDLPKPVAFNLKDQETHIAGSQLMLHKPVFLNDSGSVFPQRPIEMPVEWLEYLNPTTTVSQGTNSTVINAYMSHLANDPSEWFVALTLNYMIEYALATVGIDLPWEALPEGPIDCEDCQIFEVHHQYYAWAYNTSGIAVKLAVSVMIAYCILALGHIIYLTTMGLSSDAWDSAAEVIALAMNSSPTQYLQNTCSGIYGMRPFQTTVRIVATAPTPGEKQDHLELVFGPSSEAKTSQVKMEMNEEYGAVHPRTYRD